MQKSPEVMSNRRLRSDDEARRPGLGPGRMSLQLTLPSRRMMQTRPTKIMKTEDQGSGFRIGQACFVNTAAVIHSCGAAIS